MQTLSEVAPSATPTAPAAGLDAQAQQALHERSREAAALLRAMANPERLLLLCHLLDDEPAVAELGARTGITQPTLSQQLGVLRQQGLVATRRDGKFVHYRVATPAVEAVLRTLHALYCAPDGIANATSAADR